MAALLRYALKFQCTPILLHKVLLGQFGLDFIALVIGIEIGNLVQSKPSIYDGFKQTHLIILTRALIFMGYWCMRCANVTPQGWWKVQNSGGILQSTLSQSWAQPGGQQGCQLHTQTLLWKLKQN